NRRVLRHQPLAFHFSKTANASAGDTPARAANQQATGAAVRSAARAASPASRSKSLTSSSLGASTPNSAAKSASHSFAVIRVTSPSFPFPVRRHWEDRRSIPQAPTPQNARPDVGSGVG